MVSVPEYGIFVFVDGPLEDQAWVDRQGHGPSAEQVRHAAYRRLAEGWHPEDIRAELRGQPYTPGPGLPAEPGTRDIWWIGCTDFRLPQLQMSGLDIRPILRQRESCGFKLVRVLGMKHDNTGWALNPDFRPLDHYFQSDLPRFFDTLAAAGFQCEWNVFADTAYLPGFDNPAKQQEFWRRSVAAVLPYASFVRLSVGNEVTHTHHQRLNPAAFAQPNGIEFCRGSSQTNETPVKPYGTYATYGVRRDQLPDARGIARCSHWAFESTYPKSVKVVPTEMLKPENYSFDTFVAELMGRHCRCGDGGTFHSGEGVNGWFFPPRVEACARAFCKGLL